MNAPSISAPSPALILFALSSIACAPHPPPAEATEPPRPAAPTAPVAPPAPSATASAAPAPEAGTRREVPPRTGAPGSTRGTISCGDARCTAPGEVCIWNAQAFAWTCTPSSAGPAGAIRFACDDGTDCPAGETCCQRFVDTDGAVCVPRAEVNSTCNIELCLRDGARCPPGRTCASTSGDKPGDCVAPAGPATCGGRKRCPSDAPVCVRHQGKLACAARDSLAWKAATARWECTLQSDCNAGDTCSFSFGDAEPEVVTYCARYSPGYRGTLVCDPAGPGYCGNDAECRKTSACNRMTGELPWLGAWGAKEQ